MNNLIKNSNNDGNNSLPRLIAILFGTNHGNYSSGLDNFQAEVFDASYFKIIDNPGWGMLECLKDCTIHVKACICKPGGGWTVLLKNASAWYNSGTTLLGAGRVDANPFVEDAEVTLSAGDHIGGSYQIASDRANGGGCWLFYI